MVTVNKWAHTAFMYIKTAYNNIISDTCFQKITSSKYQHCVHLNLTYLTAVIVNGNRLTKHEYNIIKQGVALTGRDCTDPPCSVGRPTARRVTDYNIR